MSWEEAAPAPVGRCNHSAILLNNLIYVGSGVESGGKVSFTIDVYNLDDEKWGKSIDTPWSDFGVAIFNNKLFIIGGKSKKGDTSKIVRSLEQSNKWEEITSMSTARSNCTVVSTTRCSWSRGWWCYSWCCRVTNMLLSETSWIAWRNSAAYGLKELAMSKGIFLNKGTKYCFINVMRNHYYLWFVGSYWHPTSPIGYIDESV